MSGDRHIEEEAHIKQVLVSTMSQVESEVKRVFGKGVETKRQGTPQRLFHSLAVAENLLYTQHQLRRRVGHDDFKFSALKQLVFSYSWPAEHLTWWGGALNHIPVDRAEAFLFQSEGVRRG